MLKTYSFIFGNYVLKAIILELNISTKYIC